MAVSKDDILEAIANMTVMEVTELVSAMEEKFGVSAQAAVAAAPVVVAGGEDGGDSAPSSVTVTLTSAGGNKIAVIKAVKAITDTGLKEAKEIVDGAPKAIKENIDPKEAEEIKKQLEEAGATVEVK